MITNIWTGNWILPIFLWYAQSMQENSYAFEAAFKEIMFIVPRPCG